MRDIQKVIGALSSPVRREILALTWDRELPAGEIAAAFSVSKPTISQHLAVLREADLVTATAVGTSRRYRARQEVLRGLHAALGDSRKWENADDSPERALADATAKPMVLAQVEVESDQESSFRAFSDPEIYSRWLGAPVTIEDGRFSCTMEWGTEIRGRYVLVAPPQLIVMSWTFEDANVPVPGDEMTGYLWIHPTERGSRVEVHQLVDTMTQAEFMEGAWTTVLGRFKAGGAEALDQRTAMPPRVRRPKRRSSL
jgi:DNA-binding transcriptional ArsR family regulator/uncharacterized protein YndB with AHSA1/START domain